MVFKLLILFSAKLAELLNKLRVTTGATHIAQVPPALETLQNRQPGPGGIGSYPRPLFSPSPDLYLREASQHRLVLATQTRRPK